MLIAQIFGVRTKKLAFLPKEMKRTHKKTLEVEKYYTSKIQPMSEELMAESMAKLGELARVDKERVMLEEAKNLVESYTYLIKNKLIDNEESIAKVTTEEQREELSKLAKGGEEWMEDDVYDADLATTQAKYAELSEPAEKVWFRVKEMSARPEAILALQAKLIKVEELLEKWKTTMPHITEEERDEVTVIVKELRDWITETEEKQAATESHEDPAFTSKEVPLQTKSLEKVIGKLSRKPKPKAPKKEEKEEEAGNATKAGNETDAGDESKDGSEEAAEEAVDAETEAPADVETETEESADKATEEEAVEGDETKKDEPIGEEL
jgi:hypoxia up-regulated 1